MGNTANATLALGDDDFVEAFSQCRLPDGFPHRAHVRLAWLYVRRHGVREAAEEAVAGIRRLAAAEGAPEQFHETITRAWVYLVAAAEQKGRLDDFDAFVTANPDLLDKSLLSRHYTPARLERGRRGWVPPDLAVIPGAPSTASAPAERSAPSFVEVMRLIPWAVAVVTTHRGATVHGSTVSSVTPLSRNPELVLICVRNGSRLLERIHAGRAFAISFLAQGQSNLATRFADPGRPGGAAQFRGVPHRAGTAGPVLTDAAAWLECKLRHKHAGGDHTIVTGEITAAGIEPHHPLLRWNGTWIGE